VVKTIATRYVDEKETKNNAGIICSSMLCATVLNIKKNKKGKSF
jgi:hypothetical protein